MSEVRQEGPSAKGGPDFEDLFLRAPCGYLTVAADGRITRSNLTFARWMGRPADALAGVHLRALLTVPGRILYETNIAPALRLQGEVDEVTLDLVTADDRRLPVIMSASRRAEPAGAPVETLMIFLKARDRRRYERTLQGRAADAAERLADERAASELREQFIAVLGHDLRNPLASILGATHLLRREETSDEAVHVLKMMETSVDRMAGLIDDVMDFARGRLGGGIKVELKTEALESVLRQVVSELEISEPGRVFVCAFDLGEPISFDAPRIAQLASNLLGNALAHGDARSPVRLNATTCEGQLTLSVCNAGPAIPVEAVSRLFQPFFRGDVRDSRQGLGLGLHIASEIAKAHDGVLNVRSDDVETCFTLTMPCRPPGGSAPDAGAGTP